MAMIPLSDARAQFFDLVDRAAAGEPITLTNRGVPRAMVVPVPSDPQPPLLSGEQAVDLLMNHQMDAGAWDDIRFEGDTIGEDGLG
ncbi:MAG: type II toxin-antitoxin system Phd/YefM family antitoxin [Micrococcales bacterium]|nr:type II toxin-antitoxin system Phd/YefM family antitoxin [Micrococcales bacterium]